jgi:hypothetical protein
MIENTESGQIDGIYCHHDGYYENNGALLAMYYNSYEKAKELIELGDISSLEATIEKTDAYHRDHKEDLNVRRNIDPNKMATEYSYVYLFRDGRWITCDNSIWQKLTDILDREGIAYKTNENTAPAVPSGYIELDPTKMYAIPIKNGYLDIRVSQDPDYPGLDIEYISNNEAKVPREQIGTRPRVVIENPKPDDDKEDVLRALVWGDKGSEDYTDEVVFDDIDG